MGALLGSSFSPRLNNHMRCHLISTILKEFQSSKNSKTRKLKTLYQLILNYGPIRAEKLAEQANMKAATCARLLDELSKMSLISTSELGESTGGRKPILYSVNPNDGYLVGIEMSNLYLTILLLNLNLTILDMVKIKTEKIDSPKIMIDNLLPKVDQLLLKHQLTTEDILGIGISIDHILANIETTDDTFDSQIKSLEEYIRKKTSAYVTLGCGIYFAALAEYRLRYTSSQRFMFTTCDTDIRSCNIINNQFSFTQLGAANVFGHTTIDIHGSQCECGSFGCLNHYSSLSAIKNHIIQQLREGKPSAISSFVSCEEEIDYHIIFQALAINDPVSVSALEKAAYYYGIAIANTILALQPDVVVCGGTLTPKNNFFAMTKQSIENKLAAFPQIKTKIYPANDSYEIVAQGAGGMVLENLLTSE